MVIQSLKVHCKVTSRFAHYVITSQVVNSADQPKEVAFSVEIPKTAFISDFAMCVPCPTPPPRTVHSLGPAQDHDSKWPDSVLFPHFPKGRRPVPAQKGEQSISRSVLGSHGGQQTGASDRVSSLGPEEQKLLSGLWLSLPTSLPRGLQATPQAEGGPQETHPLPP